MNLTLVETGRRFRDGSLSPADLARDLLARMKEENPRLNAWYEIFAETALAEAARAGRELREGRDRGPLHGIPIGLKDLIDVRGSVTTAGAHPAFRPPPAAADAEVVRRLRDAGAVLLGKTALHEWALGVTTNNAHFGPTRNPHDPERIPGGSSGGSAAAVAAGHCLAAIGTDTGGSIRIPSSLCGTVGIKPTYGTVSLQGVFPLSSSLDHVGPIAATVEDAFLVLEAISDFRRSDRPLPRVLVPKGWFFDDLEPGLADLVRKEASRHGPVTEVDLGDIQRVWDANTTILLSDAASVHEERLRDHPEWFGGTLAERFSGGLKYRGVDYARARNVQRDWQARLAALLGDHSVLAVPATPVPAVPIGDREGAPIARIMTRFTAPFNLAGVPVLSMPVGRIGKLPVGMQWIAGAGQESLLYAVGRTAT